MKSTLSSLKKVILKSFFVNTDLGMIFYLSITYLKLIPEELLFKDYTNPILMSWNWSFLFEKILILIDGFLIYTYFYILGILFLELL